MRIRDRSPSVSSDRELDTRAFSSLRRRRRSSVDRCDGRAGFLPLPFPLPFPFPFPLSYSERKVSLCAPLYQLRTCIGIEIVVPCTGEKNNCVQFGCLVKRNIVQSKRRRKRFVFFVVVVIRSFFSVIASGINRGLDKRSQIHPGLYRSNNRLPQRR